MNEVKHLFENHGNELAAVIMEPTRTEDPHPGFLECIRDLTEKNDVKLIFDEISIGWRLCLGGAHLLYGVNPDMAVFAKTISNGFAMGAVIGNKKTMQAAQNSFISSAYWTEGIGPAASVACIEKMKKIDVPSHLSKIGKYFQMKWKETGEKFNLPVFSKGCGLLYKINSVSDLANKIVLLMNNKKRRLYSKNAIALINKKFSWIEIAKSCLLYTSPSPRDGLLSRMPSSA